MKNNLKIALLSTVVLGGVVVTTTNVHAADVATKNSNAIVKFIADDTSTTPPVDPTDPTEETKPTDPTDPDGPGEGTKGPLSLDFVSSFDFGVQKITSTDQVYQAKAQIITDKDGNAKNVPNYAQVTDNRGTLAGWSLSVKQNGQFKDSTGKELTGATINIANASIQTASESTVSTLSKTMTLDALGASQGVMSANKGEGAGTFVYQMGSTAGIKENNAALESNGSKDAAGFDKTGKRVDSADVTLNVPGKTVKMADTYKTTLTWTLSDTPAS